MNKYIILSSNGSPRLVEGFKTALDMAESWAIADGFDNWPPIAMVMKASRRRKKVSEESTLSIPELRTAIGIRAYETNSGGWGIERIRAKNVGGFNSAEFEQFYYMAIGRFARFSAS